MVKNVHGVDMIYPTNPDKRHEWFLHGNPSSDPRATGDLGDDVEPVGPDEYEAGDNGQVRLTVTPVAGYSEVGIGGCDQDFAESIERGFSVTKDDWTNIEMVGYFKCSSFSPSDNRLILKGPTNQHPSNSSPCCQGFSYGARLSWDNPTVSSFFKEMYHVNYFTKNEKELSSIGNLKTGNWFGFAYCNYEITLQNGNKARKLEQYVDPNGDGSGWIKTNEIIDQGGWGSGGDECGGDDDQILNFGASRAMWRWDATGGTDLTFKWLSCREINPTGSFGEDPNNPDPNQGGGSPTETVQVLGTFKLQRDINIIRTNACSGTGGGGGGGGGSGNILYNISADNDKPITDHSSESNRTRCAAAITGSSSVLTGKTAKYLTVPLKKTGSPGASPTVSAKIWNSSNAVVYTSPTTYDPSTFTTSFVDKTFDFSTNTRVFAVGDKIGVEYVGTSSSNYIECGYDSNSVSNIKMGQYEGGSWDLKDTREFACKIED